MKVEKSILGPLRRNLKSTIKKKVVTRDHRSIPICVILHSIQKGTGHQFVKQQRWISQTKC